MNATAANFDSSSAGGGGTTSGEGGGRYDHFSSQQVGMGGGGSHSQTLVPMGGGMQPPVGGVMGGGDVGQYGGGGGFVNLSGIGPDQGGAGIRYHGVGGYEFQPYEALQQQNYNATDGQAEGVYRFAETSTYDGSRDTQQQCWEPPPPLQQSQPPQQPLQDARPVQPGAFYPTTQFLPHLYNAPVSSLAYDSVTNALYVASDVQPLASPDPRGHRLFSTAPTLSPKRASVLSTHSATDGALHATCVAHEEASPEVLDEISRVMYDCVPSHRAVPSGVRGMTGAGSRMAVPNHAYRPSYCRLRSQGLVTTPHGNPHVGPASLSSQPGHSAGPGITKILPFRSPLSGSFGGGGFVCTVSPAMVRVHSAGGLLLSENDGLRGMIAGTLHGPGNGYGGGDATMITHATVGGLAVAPSHGGIGRCNLHRIDLYQGLRIVSSHSIIPSKDDQRRKDAIAIMDLATNWEKNTIVAGCSDGTVRILDGGWRKKLTSGGGGGEVAKVKGHGGGVTRVAVSEDGNLICTTGYTPRSSSTPSTSTPYAFPDQHVLIFDVRYLGRGGTLHPFSGFNGGPRFVSFLRSPDGNNQVLLGSGQSMGGLQIVTPFDNMDQGFTSKPEDYLQPNLNPGESMTDISVSGSDLAIGTSAGYVLQFRRAGSYTVHATSSSSAMSDDGAVGPSGGRGGLVPGGNTPMGGGGPLHRLTLSTDEKEPLVAPPYPPPPPEFSIDPAVLQSDALRGGLLLGLPNSIFNGYVLNRDPTLTPLGDCSVGEGRRSRNSGNTFGQLADRVMVRPAKRVLSTGIVTGAVASSNGGDGDDFIATIPASDLKLDLLSWEGRAKEGSGANRPEVGEGGGAAARASGGYEISGKGTPNPNKTLFAPEVVASCYDTNADPRKNNDRGAGGTRRGDGRSGGISAGGTGGQAGSGHGCANSNTSTDHGNNDRNEQHFGNIPPRYRLTTRPSHYSNFDYDLHNETGLWPGWDYPPSMPSATASPILLLLYFVPEIRKAMLAAQYDKRLFEGRNKMSAFSAGGGTKIALKGVENGPILSPELGFLFHKIDSLSRHALVHNGNGGNRKASLRNNHDKLCLCPKVGAFAPTNFLAAFASLPEASALALLDGSPEAVEVARRPEAFYRFLVHHLDTELAPAGSEGSEAPSVSKSDKLIDSLQGMNFTSVNEFVTGSGPPTISSTRALTVDLSYEPFVNQKEEPVSSSRSDFSTSFGAVLRYSLCKESRLRAWCEATRSYETVVQRKIATSLPSTLSLSCACAGKNGTDDGALRLWRGGGCGDRNDAGERHWLPETIEVELEPDGDVTVRELVGVADSGSEGKGCEEWVTFRGRSALPQSVSSVLTTRRSKSRTVVRYCLEAVVSFVRGSHKEEGDGAPSLEPDGNGSSQNEGHHVLHIRVPRSYTARALSLQLQEAERCAERTDSEMDPGDPDCAIAETSKSSGRNSHSSEHWTLTSGTPSEVYRHRSKVVRQKLEDFKRGQGSGSKHQQQVHDSWVLVNGFVVTKIAVDDARAFQVPFKEPCLVIFREVHDASCSSGVEASVDLRDGSAQLLEDKDSGIAEASSTIPLSIMETPSISTGLPPAFAVNSSSDLPGYGDLVAFDAEFVAVQHEESALTATGSKITTRQMRHALARVSVVDCKSGNVIIDDHVLPREAVVDFLTRFSGVVRGDLDPIKSPHHLITMRDAYLKLRLLLDRGCIFVGHGLSQDFLIVNIFVPPSQIIDTVQIFHKEKMRYISLRFLANYLLSRDMQQDTHDSIEDARAAYDIYLKALDFKKRGLFESVLSDIYDYGQRTEWKLGVEDVNAQ